MFPLIRYYTLIKTITIDFTVAGLVASGLIIAISFQTSQSIINSFSQQLVLNETKDLKVDLESNRYENLSLLNTLGPYLDSRGVHFYLLKGNGEVIASHVLDESGT